MAEETLSYSACPVQCGAMLIRPSLFVTLERSRSKTCSIVKRVNFGSGNLS
jgi:hypothetical protein